MMDVSLLTVNAAGLPPNVTKLAPVNPDPVRLTVVPPAVSPVVTSRPVTEGVAAGEDGGVPGRHADGMMLRRRL